jgi:hypothetical protein
VYWLVQYAEARKAEWVATRYFLRSRCAIGGEPKGRGTFVVNRDARIVYAHQSKTAADIPAIDDILAAVQSAARKTPRVTLRASRVARGRHHGSEIHKAGVDLLDVVRLGYRIIKRSADVGLDQTSW